MNATALVANRPGRRPLAAKVVHPPGCRPNEIRIGAARLRRRRPGAAEAASLFLSLARHKRGAARRDRPSLKYLSSIGAIVTDPMLFPRSTETTVFYHGQSPGDGYFPVSSNAFAQRQLGSIIAAWEEYSNRKDRETPWFMQRGVTAIEDWPAS